MLESTPYFPWFGIRITFLFIFYFHFQLQKLRNLTKCCNNRIKHTPLFTINTSDKAKLLAIHFLTKTKYTNPFCKRDSKVKKLSNLRVGFLFNQRTDKNLQNVD